MSKQDIAVERKDQIVRATIACMADLGYTKFSMQDVAKRAGLSKGIIHYYFLNKDDLMLSVLRYVSSDIESLLQESMADEQNSAGRLRAFFRICCGVVSSYQQFYQVSMDFWTQINQNEEVRETIASHYQKLREACAAEVARGVRDGSFRSVDPIHYASFVLAVVDGVSLQWLFDRDIDFEALVKLGEEQILYGLLLSMPRQVSASQ